MFNVWKCAAEMAQFLPFACGQVQITTPAGGVIASVGRAGRVWEHRKTNLLRFNHSQLKYAPRYYRIQKAYANSWGNERAASWRHANRSPAVSYGKNIVLVLWPPKRNNKTPTVVPLSAQHWKWNLFILKNIHCFHFLCTSFRLACWSATNRTALRIRIVALCYWATTLINKITSNLTSKGRQK